MMILDNKDKVIKYSLSSVIRENKYTDDKMRFAYTPELPTVICNNKQDAEYIQKEINMFVNKIIKNLMN